MDGDYSFVDWNPLTGTIANSEDPDVTFHQGLHRLLTFDDKADLQIQFLLCIFVEVRLGA